MKRIHLLLLTGLALISLCYTQGLSAQDKTKYKDLEDALRSGRPLSGEPGPANLNWIDGGTKYAYTTRDEASGTEEIRSFDPATGKDELLLSSSDLHFPGTDSAFEYRSFQWSADSRHIVFETNFQRLYRRSGVSDFYVYSLQDKTMQIAARGARTAQLSPDGKKMGIERDGNLFVYDLDTKQETQLTHDTGENLFNGHFDWVYEEEFGKGQAWDWSPDSKYISFWHFDESGVPIFQMTNYEGTHPQYTKIPIPQPGDPNPAVKIGVVDVSNGQTTWLNTGMTGDFYTPRVYWTSDPGKVAVMTLNRAENDMKLFMFDLSAGTNQQIMEEKNNTWVAIFNFYTGVDDMMFFPDKIHNFFWISDRSGYYQIYRYDYNGHLINRVTNGNWDVNLVPGINPSDQTIYYTSAEASPLEEQLYSVRFDGTKEKRLTMVSGYHRVNMSPNQQYYLDSYSNISTPPHIELWGTNQKLIKTLKDGASVIQYLKTHAYSPTELFRFPASDGTMLDGSLVRPTDFDSTKKYPVIFAIYGGPESHGVYNTFQTSAWKEFMAQQGYFVVDINNRGIAGYGSVFMKVVYKQLGKYESGDCSDAAKWLAATYPYLDGNNMAIMGTSYGGYTTVFTMVSHPGVFKVGIANSPVTDWRLYDDIYTERYMAPLDDNLDGYKESSAMTHAAQLTGHLLLIHSTMDDNVHPRNTMQLLTALTNANKDVDFRLYPPGGHGAAYNLQSYMLIEKVSFQYLEKYLKGKCDQPSLNQ